MSFKGLPPAPQKSSGAAAEQVHCFQDPWQINASKAIFSKRSPSASDIGCLCWIGNQAGLDGQPFRCLHAGQVGGLVDGAVARYEGFLDAAAKKPSPDQTGGRADGVLIERCHTHILHTPNGRAGQGKSRPRRFDYLVSIYSTASVPKTCHVVLISTNTCLALPAHLPAWLFLEEQPTPPSRSVLSFLPTERTSTGNLLIRDMANTVRTWADLKRAPCTARSAN